MVSYNPSDPDGPDGLEEARQSILGGMVMEVGPDHSKPRTDMNLPEFYIALYPPPGSVSAQALRVLEHARGALQKFLEKNQGYGSTAYNLGARGQYADINRKMGKLKHTLWDGNDPVGEDMIEMLQDLVGHCLLTIDFIEQENK